MEAFTRDLRSVWPIFGGKDGRLLGELVISEETLGHAKLGREIRLMERVTMPNRYFGFVGIYNETVDVTHATFAPVHFRRHLIGFRLVSGNLDLVPEAAVAAPMARMVEGDL